VNSADIQKLRAKAHHLNPVVMIGAAGLTAAVLAEIELALLAHELIKIKIRAEKALRQQMTQQICTETKAELVQTIGQCTVVYRLNPDR
jgi:RNA-binding protein